MWLFLIILWMVIGGAIVGSMSSDSNTETRHMVMGFFWPITVIVFLIVGPVAALYHSIKMVFSIFKSK